MTFGSDLPLLQWRAEFSSLAETVYSSQKPVFVLKPSHPRWGWIQTTLQSGHLRWNPAYLANTEHGLWKQISYLKCKHHVDGLCPTLLWVQWTGIKLIYLLLLLCDSLAVQTSCEFKGPHEMYLTRYKWLQRGTGRVAWSTQHSRFKVESWPLKLFCRSPLRQWEQGTGHWTTAWICHRNFSSVFPALSVK